MVAVGWEERMCMCSVLEWEMSSRPSEGLLLVLFMYHRNRHSKLDR